MHVIQIDRESTYRYLYLVGIDLLEALGIGPNNDELRSALFLPAHAIARPCTDGEILFGTV